MSTFPQESSIFEMEKDGVVATSQPNHGRQVSIESEVATFISPYMQAVLSPGPGYSSSEEAVAASSLPSTSKGKAKLPLKGHPYSYGSVNVHPTSRFKVIQKWEGVIEEIYEDHFLARLYDLKDDSIEEEADIDFELVSASDRSLVEKGAFFYLTLGYETTSWGQIQRVTRVRFKRVPPIPQEELDAALDRSNQLLKDINWE